MLRVFCVLAALAASATAASAGELDISGGVDGGATNRDNDGLFYSNLRFGYVLRPHLTLALTGRTGGAASEERWIGGLVGTVELWQQLGKLRGSLRLGGTHQHEAPTSSLEDRPLSVVGGVDDDISHRTGAVAGLALAYDLVEAQHGMVYGGLDVSTQLMVDDGGPRWYTTVGLALGFRLRLGRQPANPD